MINAVTVQGQEPVVGVAVAAAACVTYPRQVASASVDDCRYEAGTVHTRVCAVLSLVAHQLPGLVYIVCQTHVGCSHVIAFVR